MSEHQDNQLLANTGQRIRQARATHALSLTQLARLTGISASALSLVETGQRDPRLTTLNRIATALRLPLADLLAPPSITTSTNPIPSGEGYDLEDYR